MGVCGGIKDLDFVRVSLEAAIALLRVALLQVALLELLWWLLVVLLELLGLLVALLIRLLELLLLARCRNAIRAKVDVARIDSEDQLHNHKIKSDLTHQLSHRA